MPVGLLRRRVWPVLDCPGLAVAWLFAGFDGPCVGLLEWSVRTGHYVVRVMSRGGPGRAPRLSLRLGPVADLCRTLPGREVTVSVWAPEELMGPALGLDQVGRSRGEGLGLT